MDEVLLDGKPVKEAYVVREDGRKLELDKREHLLLKIYLAVWTIGSLILIATGVILLKAAQDVSDQYYRIALLEASAFATSLALVATRRPLIIVEKEVTSNEGRV